VEYTKGNAKNEDTHLEYDPAAAALLAAILFALTPGGTGSARWPEGAPLYSPFAVLSFPLAEADGDAEGRYMSSLLLRLRLYRCPLYSARRRSLFSRVSLSILSAPFSLSPSRPSRNSPDADGEGGT
jgi:hypothetical protein